MPDAIFSNSLLCWLGRKGWINSSNFFCVLYQYWLPVFVLPCPSSLSTSWCFCGMLFLICSRSSTIPKQVFNPYAHFFAAFGLIVKLINLPGPYPYRMKAISIYMSVHIPFHKPLWCLATCYPCINLFNIGAGSFFIPCK